MCFGIRNVCWWELEITLTFLDIALQHLQPGVAQPAECPSRLGVMGILICPGGSGKMPGGTRIGNGTYVTVSDLMYSSSMTYSPCVPEVV